MSTTDAITTVGLTKSYGRSRGIVDLDLSVPTSTVFGFLGPNGAGKTTTIRVLLDFLRPTRGSATVLGLDSHADSVEVHRRVGYLAGDPGLYTNVTARELLDWLGRMRGGVEPGRMEGLAERFSLELDRPIRTLSKGNRQKVGVVQAFMHRPELLVLDEPTAGLDPLIQREFQTLVREVTRDGATVFLSSHVLDEVQRTCDHVAIVREGRLVAVEAIDDLRHRATREVTIQFAGPFDADAFAALPEVKRTEVHGQLLHLHLVGSADPLVKLAAHYDVLDFTSAPADLEAFFLQYYEEPGDGERKGDGDAAAGR